LGVLAHPNLEFTDIEGGAYAFPTPGTEEATQNYIYISGRHYGFDLAACKTNFTIMVENMCGEQ
jgi:hypothetical protein